MLYKEHCSNLSMEPKLFTNPLSRLPIQLNMGPKLLINPLSRLIIFERKFRKKNTLFIIAIAKIISSNNRNRWALVATL